MEISEDGTIKVVSGDDDTMTWTYSDSRSLSSYNFFFTVKPLASVTTDDSDALYKAEPTDVTKITSKTIAIIPVADSDTRIATGTYKYDVQFILANQVSTPLSGVYKVTNDTTKRVS